MPAGRPVNLSVLKNVDARSRGALVEVENQLLGRTAVERQRRYEVGGTDIHQTRYAAFLTLDVDSRLAIATAIVAPAGGERENRR